MTLHRIAAPTLLLLAVLGFDSDLAADPILPAGTVELNDNGAWSWFMDERVMVDKGRLLVGSVRATGPHQQSDQPGWGNIELSVWDLADKSVRNIVLHKGLEQDDHNNPGLLVLEDGRYLAAYSRHGNDRHIYWRRSAEPGNPYEWEPTQVFDSPGKDAHRFGGNNVTYMNPFRFSDQPDKLYLFYRGYSLDPCYLVSTDNAKSWNFGGHWLVGRDGYSPYLKYACDGEATLHFVATEDHPRNYDNSLYHGFLRTGKLHRSNGQEMGALSTELETPLHTWDFTCVFQGDQDHVAWMTDIELDAAGHPIILFTVQRDGAGLPRGQGGNDHRFYYARWDGTAWRVQPIAYAGQRLYRNEDDYTGLGAIDPQDVNRLIISTNADPVTGEPLLSQTDGKRHHELYVGTTADQGANWTWKALTKNSDADNLRPLIPRWKNSSQLAVVWMRGSYSHNRGPWKTRVMGTLVPRP